MNWLYRFVIYLFVNAARVTLNDGTMDSNAEGYRDDLMLLSESMECVFTPNEYDSYNDGVTISSLIESMKVEHHNTFMDYLLTRLRRVMSNITDLPEKHRARLRFSSD